MPGATEALEPDRTPIFVAASSPAQSSLFQPLEKQNDGAFQKEHRLAIGSHWRLKGTVYLWKTKCTAQNGTISSRIQYAMSYTPHSPWPESLWEDMEKLRGDKGQCIYKINPRAMHEPFRSATKHILDPLWDSNNRGHPSAAMVNEIRVITDMLYRECEPESKQEIRNFACEETSATRLETSISNVAALQPAHGVRNQSQKDLSTGFEAWNDFNGASLIDRWEAGNLDPAEAESFSPQLSQAYDLKGMGASTEESIVYTAQMLKKYPGYQVPGDVSYWRLRTRKSTIQEGGEDTGDGTIGAEDAPETIEHDSTHKPGPAKPENDVGYWVRTRLCGRRERGMALDLDGVNRMLVALGHKTKEQCIPTTDPRLYKPFWSAALVNKNRMPWAIQDRKI